MVIAFTIPGEPIRTGLFRYVTWAKLDAFLRRGWVPVADLGNPHGQFAVLCWHCDCDEVMP